MCECISVGAGVRSNRGEHVHEKYHGMRMRTERMGVSKQKQTTTIVVMVVLLEAVLEQAAVGEVLAGGAASGERGESKWTVQRAGWW